MIGRLIRLFGPASGYRREDRRLLGLMYVAGLFQGYAQTQAVNTLPFVRLTFGLTGADMSRLFAVARIGALVAVVYAVFGDRWGRRGSVPLRVPDAAGCHRSHRVGYLAFPLHRLPGHGPHGIGGHGDAGYRIAGRAGSLGQPGLGDQLLRHRGGAGIGRRSAGSPGSADERTGLAVALRRVDHRVTVLSAVEGEGSGKQGVPLYGEAHQPRIPSGGSLRRTILAGGHLQPVDQRLLGGSRHLLSRAPGERSRLHERRSGEDHADRRYRRRHRILSRRTDR